MMNDLITYFLIALIFSCIGLFIGKILAKLNFEKEKTTLEKEKSTLEVWIPYSIGAQKINSVLNGLVWVLKGFEIWIDL